ncbi:MAG: Vms1/Ankzf1 family peptidyl-tRNA hydrolase [Dehalococcoidia bacterium]|nr:Vms1/Ankzf1 family peptidyl-tRNA hydrolase [Dehalococcoidia bacterium]
MPVDSGASGPILTHRSRLLERLIDFEIEVGAEFVVELLPHGYVLPGEWEWLPRSAGESENGIVLINAEVRPSALQPRVALLPPFPITDTSKSNSFDDLRKFISEPRAVGIILLRLGHYAVGIAEDGELVTTKSGSRYVKGQHRKGGQSSNRFRRNREKWIRELFDSAGEIAKSRFSEYPGQIDHLALGGDRVVLGQFLKRVKLPDGLAERVLPNRLPVDQPGRKALDTAVHDAWSFRVFEPASDVGDRVTCPPITKPG